MKVKVKTDMDNMSNTKKDKPKEWNIRKQGRREKVYRDEHWPEKSKKG